MEQMLSTLGEHLCEVAAHVWQWEIHPMILFYVKCHVKLQATSRREKGPGPDCIEGTSWTPVEQSGARRQRVCMRGPGPGGAVRDGVQGMRRPPPLPLPQVWMRVGGASWEGRVSRVSQLPGYCHNNRRYVLAVAQKGRLGLGARGGAGKRPGGRQAPRTLLAH